MAQYTFRADLASKPFPLLSAEFGRTVISPTKGETVESNTPQVYFCENVMPTKEGYDSVGTEYVLGSSATVVTNKFTSAVFRYTNLTGSELQACFTSDGKLQLRAADVVWTGGWWSEHTLWAFTGAGDDVFRPYKVTMAEVRGVTYFYYEGKDVVTYDEGTSTFVPVTLTGLALTGIKGILGANGYMIAYSVDSVAWSSTIDPTDFTPSTITGAGGGSVADIAGAITRIYKSPLGFIVYTTGNAVAAVYTANASYPFKFKEVDGSKGLLTNFDSMPMIAANNNETDHFMFSNVGFLTVNTQRAAPVFSEISDFAAEATIESYNSTTGIIEQSSSYALKLQLWAISPRFIIISYGLADNSVFSHAIIYDRAIQRLGKIKLDHVACTYGAQQSRTLSYETIQFIQLNGQVLRLSKDGVHSDSVLFLGRFQAVRSRTLTVQEVSVEEVGEADTLAVSITNSFEGKSSNKVTGSLAYNSLGVRRYLFRTTAAEHSIVFAGKFSIDSVLITFSLHGRR